MFKYIKTSLWLAAPLLPLSLVYPKNRPAPGATSPNATGGRPDIQGGWYFNSIITEGAGRGSFQNGQLAVGASKGKLSGKLVLPGIGIKEVQANQNSLTVTLTFDSITAQGQFRGENIITGTFTGLNGAKGRWVVSRDFENLTKVAGRFNFDATVGTQKLTGLMELDQQVSIRSGFRTVYPAITGSLATANGTFSVTGIANGGEVYLVISDGSRQWFAYDINLTDDSLSGTVYRADNSEQGSWKATLVPERPNIGRNWGFHTETANSVKGHLSLKQDASGNLSGTFAAENEAPAAVTGLVTLQGQVTLSFKGLTFQGQFEFAIGQVVSGTFSNPATGTTAEWRMKVKYV